MKVSSINNLKNDVSCNQNNFNKNYLLGIKNNTPGDSVSFRGAALKDGATGIFKWIEKHGFFVEFLIVDTFSMIIPRIGVGLNRDRDKTGQLNYKAGAEEAGREIMSGPGMNLIPMAILALVSKYRPASHMETSTLDILTDKMEDVVNTGVKLEDKQVLSTQLAEQLFEKAFDSESFTLSHRSSYKNKFANLLKESTDLKPKNWFAKIINKLEGSTGNPYDNKRKEFEELVVKINNSNKNSDVEPGNTKGLFNDKVNASDLFDDFRNYSNDIITKLTKEDFTQNVTDTCKKSAVEFLEKAKNVRGRIKLATAITGFMAVGAFLLYLPKLYQQGGLSPAEESAKRARGENIGGANENQ